jgi:hypothetical protein
MWDLGSARFLQGMFEGGFNAPHEFGQDLCAWCDTLDPSADVTGMFAYTACPNTSDPDLSQTPPGPLCYRCRPKCKSVSACTNLLWQSCGSSCNTASSCFDSALEDCCPGASVPTNSYQVQVLAKYKDQHCHWCTKDEVCATQLQVKVCVSSKNCSVNASCLANAVSRVCCHGFIAKGENLNRTRVNARNACLDKNVCNPPPHPIRLCAAKVRRSCHTCNSMRLEACLQQVVARTVNTMEGCCLPGGQEEKTKNVEKALIVYNSIYGE